MDEELAPAPGAALVPPPEEELAPAPDAPLVPPAAAVAPAPSKLESFAHGALQGGSLGFIDELNAAADAAASKIPGVRTVLQHFQGDKPSLTDPSITYQQRRDAYRAGDTAAHDAHPGIYTAGEVGGGLATAAVPGLGALKGAGAVKVGLQGAAIGAAAGLGGSNADTAGGLAKDTAIGAGIGGVGGAVVHAAGHKVASLIAERLPGLQAGAQASADALAKEELAGSTSKNGLAAWSKTRGMVTDPDTVRVINEPIQLGNKTISLAQIASKPASEVRPVLAARQAQLESQLAPIYEKADQKSGGVPLSDLINHYEGKVSEYGKDPLSEPSVNATENAKQSVLKAWGPKAEEVAARKQEIGNKLNSIYDKTDKATGGVRVGDLLKHYDDQISELAKSPGNQTFVKSLEDAKSDVVKAWATRDKFDPAAVVKGGSLDGQKAGDAIALLEKQKAAAPQYAAELDAEIGRIKQGATTNGYDPDVRVPAKNVRAFATTLQDRAAPDVTNPSLGKQVRTALGSTTRDFVNGHVEQALGAKDGKALTDLNKRMSTLYQAEDVMSGAEKDPKIRDAVLGEFNPKVSSKDVNRVASRLEERGSDTIDRLNPGPATQAKRELASTTREFLNKHAGNVLGPEDRATLEDLNRRHASLGKIDKTLEEREQKEIAGRLSGEGRGAKALKGLGYVGAAALAPHAMLPALGAAAAPTILENGAPLLRHGVTRGTNSLLAKIAEAAAGGNPWAQRQMAMLRQVPGGLARIAALHRASGGGGSIPVEATQPGDQTSNSIASAP